MLYVYPYYYYVALMNNQALWDLKVSTYVRYFIHLLVFPPFTVSWF